MRMQRGNTTRLRKDFAKISSLIDVPFLLRVQTSSYERFLQRFTPPGERLHHGLQAVFDGIFPISDFKGTASQEFVSYTIGEEKYDAEECRERGMTYSAPLKVTIRMVLYDKEAPTEKTVREVKEQEVYFGEVPLMTPTGTFIINGTERVVVSQMHKSPGVFFDSEKSKTSPIVKILYASRMIPYRGSWLDFEFDTKDILNARIDRRRKFHATIFLQAMGMSKQKILDTFYDSETISQPSPGVFQKKLHEKLDLGHKVRLNIYHPKGKEVLLKEGQKITRAAMKKLQAAGVEEIPVSPEELAGQVIARDVVDEKTGEVLLESNTEIDDTVRLQILELEIPRFDILVIDNESTTHHLCRTLRQDPIKRDEKFEQEAQVDIYKRMRPGEPPTVETSRVFFENLFFEPKRYDLSPVGRMKLNLKLGLDISNDVRTLTREDIIETVRRLISINAGQGRPDDVDHLGNRRVKSVGELLENQFRIGLVRMERAIKERMAVQELDELMPHDLINARPVDAAIKEFFGSSQLSQFMDQTNPLAEITHKRRLSALGPGGLTRERAGFEVRDVHPTHYGRVCPIETPEGPNIGLITSLSTYARVNDYGFIETPYREVKKGRVTDNLRFLSADEEEKYVIAQANNKIDDDGMLVSARLSARRGGDFIVANPEEVDFIDVSPKQIVSVATALIPFLEHDDANRALMGSNMQRQAVPLMVRESPLVGTGMEAIAARDSGVNVMASFDGVVEKVDAGRIILRNVEKGSENGNLEVKDLIKYRRSNQNTCVNQVPIVDEGDRVRKGDVLADGPAIDHGELALGKNVLVAFMPWGGYNFEDAILLSDRLVEEDVFTSIHIEEFEVEARDTKLGKEEITCDIPNVSEEALRNLDDSGIIRIAAEVKSGDILVGKVTPKGETQLTPEEKLLRAIFGEKAGDVRDSSLVMSPGIEGTVIDVRVFSRRGASKDERTKAIEDEEIKRFKKVLHDETKIVKEEEMKRIIALFEGRPAPKRMKGKGTSAKIIVKAGEEMTAEALRKVDLEQLVGPKVLKDEALLLEVERTRELAEAQIAQVRKKYEDKVQRLKKGDDLPPGVIKLVKVYIAIKRKISVGDKMAGRHGNKGVVSMILPAEDMPFLPDGRPVDIVLNPLGVPSRMNVGQILETHLGWAVKGLGEQVAAMARSAEADKLRRRLEEIFDRPDQKSWVKSLNNAGVKKVALELDRGVRIATPVFDGATEEEIRSVLEQAGLPPSGKTVLYDGRTGQPFDEEVTVGYIYMLKLHHLVADKIHARSIGPYSLVTQQPLGGKAQFGGQRFGEMEVWALEAYGAAYVLQEILTVKSDDVVGRTKVYESIVKGRNLHQAGLPESFNVLVKELQGLGLDVEMIEQRSGGRS